MPGIIHTTNEDPGGTGGGTPPPPPPPPAIFPADLTLANIPAALAALNNLSGSTYTWILPNLSLNGVVIFTGTDAEILAWLIATLSLIIGNPDDPEDELGAGGGHHHSIQDLIASEWTDVDFEIPDPIDFDE